MPYVEPFVRVGAVLPFPYNLPIKLMPNDSQFEWLMLWATKHDHLTNAEKKEQLVEWGMSGFFEREKITLAVRELGLRNY